MAIVTTTASVAAPVGPWTYRRDDTRPAFAASGTNVAMVGSDRIWIGTSKSRMLRSTDGGRTWSVHDTPMATGEATGIFSIALRDASNGMVRVVGANGPAATLDVKSGSMRYLARGADETLEITSGSPRTLFFSSS